MIATTNHRNITATIYISIATHHLFGVDNSQYQYDDR